MEELKIHPNGQWELVKSKKITRPKVDVHQEVKDTSYPGKPNDLGVNPTAKPAKDAPIRTKKYQGGDPRHALKESDWKGYRPDVNHETTRAGNKRETAQHWMWETPDKGTKIGAATSGRSTLRGKEREPDRIHRLPKTKGRKIIIN